VKYQPTPAHAAILRAAIAPVPAAADAWLHWRASHDVADADSEEVRVLPAIASRLAAVLVDDRDLQRMHRLRREAWAANTVRAARSALLASSLASDGIDSVFFKGLGVLPFWADPTARRMSDADILVPWRHRHEAIDHLAGLGFRPLYGTTIEQMHALDVLLPGFGMERDDGMELDLHWRPLHHMRPSPDADQVVFDSAVRAPVGTTELLVAHAGHELVLVLGHGLRTTSGAHLVAIVDAAQLLQSADFDVDRCVDLARRYERGGAVLAGCELALESMGRPSSGHGSDNVLVEHVTAVRDRLRRRPLGERLLERRLLATPGRPERRAALARDIWVAATTPAQQGGALEGLADLARHRANVPRARHLLPQAVWRLSGRAAWAHRFRRPPLGASSQPMPAEVGDNLTFGTGHDGIGALESGWWTAEAEHVWSRGREAVLVLTLDLAPEETCVLGLRIAPFLSSGSPEMRVDVRVNGRPRTRAYFARSFHATEWQRLTIRGCDLDQGRCEVMLLVHGSSSPEAAGLSTDERQLGVALLGLTIEAS